MGVLFDGDNDRLSVPAAASLRPASAWSFACWMKTNSNWDSGVGRKDFFGTATNWWALYNWTSGAITVAFDGTNKISYTTDLTAGEWHHICGVLEGVNGTGRMYFDGVQRATFPNLTMGDFNNPVHFGVTFFSSAYQNYADVVLAECCCGPKALTTAEVQQLYAGGMIVRNTPIAVFGDALEAYWRLEDDQHNAVVGATSVKDSSGNGHHQTVVGSTPLFKATPAATLGAGPLIVQAPAVVVGNPWYQYQQEALVSGAA